MTDGMDGIGAFAGAFAGAVRCSFGCVVTEA